MRHNTRLIIAIVAALSLASIAVASPKKATAKITKKQAIATVKAKFPNGKISEVELEKEQGKLVWSMDVRVGKETQEVWVDANSGEITHTEVESAEHEKEEKSEERREHKQHEAKKQPAVNQKP